ncbi:MAG: hypothetical protein Q8N13_10355 [Acidovorax sp.]|nr:hypothetical protein [Acidovorax sp.]
MSKLGQLKKKVRYEGNVPRCATCRNYRQASIRLSTDSNTFRKNQHCALHHFTVTPNAICQDWVDAQGNTLEAAP